MESNGGYNQNHSSNNNQQEYHQQQARHLNEYPLHANHQITGFNGDIMGYLYEKNLTQRQVQYQTHYSGFHHLQTNYQNSITEVGESSNRFMPNQQVQESPIGLSLSNSMPVVDQSQLAGSSRTSNKQKRKKKSVASKESKFKAVTVYATSIQIGYWAKESKNTGDVAVKFYYGKKKLIWEFLYGPLKKKMEIRWSQVSAFKIYDDEQLNGYIELELSEPPELSDEEAPTAKRHTKWNTAEDDFTGGQAFICRRHMVKCPPGVLSKPICDLLRCDSHLHSLSQKPFPRYSPPFHNPNDLPRIPATNNGIHYVPNQVQPSGCFVGMVYPNIPSPALTRRGSGTTGVTPPTLNQIATRYVCRTPGTNGVQAPALNQTATGPVYKTPGTNGVQAPALNQPATRPGYKTPGTNGVYAPALNQTATRPGYKPPGTSGVQAPTLNQIATSDFYGTLGTNGLHTVALNQIATNGTNGVYTTALNQIAASDLFETLGENGAYTPALNQIATSDVHETPGTNGVHTAALNQIATNGTNGVYTPALNQIATGDVFETLGATGAYTPALNQIATSDVFETPVAYGAYTPALYQISTSDVHETPGTNGFCTPALNQIATSNVHETPGTDGVYTPALNQIATNGTNGVYTPALNQIATGDVFDTLGANGAYTPALNQIATSDVHETPGTNGVYTPALNQFATSDVHETPGTIGVWVERGNNGYQDMSFTLNKDDEDRLYRAPQSLITDLQTGNLPTYNEQTILNDNQTNKPSDQSYRMSPNTHHQNVEDSSTLPVGAAIPMVDSGIGGSQETNNLDILDDRDHIALLDTNIDDLMNEWDDAANGNNFEDAFKTSDGNVFPPEP